MKVVTTGAFKKNNVPLLETGKVHEEGEVIEIPDSRFAELSTKKNAFHEVFVKPYVEKQKTVEVAKKEEKKETATTKTRKKTK